MPFVIYPTSFWHIPFIYPRPITIPPFTLCVLYSRDNHPGFRNENRKVVTDLDSAACGSCRLRCSAYRSFMLSHTHVISLYNTSFCMTQLFIIFWVLVRHTLMYIYVEET
ncbi:hypothetical protein IW262DRAFT_1400557 [Armillaria fumosa]|nr:hypothetical protein IW262DRAFT_1422034 [Armillaria fumosa]KAK0215482.1 hypothetical protein IW262DRAFT_1400557 [Armillaria fumosa]